MTLNMGDSIELPTILRECGIREPQRAVEIGVFRGETSAALLREFPSLHLFMVDPWKTYSTDDPYRRSGDGCSRFSQEQQNENMAAAVAETDFASSRRTLLRLPSVRAAEFVDKPLDFVFVDGDHTFDAVRADIATWWPKVVSGGILSGHDLGHPRDGKQWGVRRAVEEFSSRERLDWNQSGSLWWLVKP